MKHKKPVSFLITTEVVIEILGQIYYLQPVQPPRAHFSDALYGLSPSAIIFATKDAFWKITKEMPLNTVVETDTPENIRFGDYIFVVAEHNNGKPTVVAKYIRQQRLPVKNKHHQQSTYSGHGRPSMFSS